MLLFRGPKFRSQNLVELVEVLAAWRRLDRASRVFLSCMALSPCACNCCTKVRAKQPEIQAEAGAQLSEWLSSMPKAPAFILLGKKAWCGGACLSSQHLGDGRQEDQEFKASLVCIVRPCHKNKTNHEQTKSSSNIFLANVLRTFILSKHESSSCLVIICTAFVVFKPTTPLENITLAYLLQPEEQRFGNN